MMEKWPKRCNKLGKVLVTLSNASFGNYGRLLDNSGMHLWANSVNDIVDCDRDKVIIMPASFLFFEFPLRYVTEIERN